MELIIDAIKPHPLKPFMCLNMIVKNESHIIKKTLTNILEKINIDYWVICDTGSTDNTREIIRDFFKEANIPGELHDDEWVNFSHNRNKAIEYAFGKSSYLFIFDADDEICGDLNLPIIYDGNGHKTMEKDAYHLGFGDKNGTQYVRILIVNNNRKGTRFEGVLHEYLSVTKGSSVGTIDGDYYLVSGRSGNRNKNPNKYLDDAIILEKAYYDALDKNDFLYNRYAFYCANSYYDAGKFEEAVKWYEITTGLHIPSEKYYSCSRLFYCYRELGQIEKGLAALVNSFKYDKQRIECVHELVVYYCNKEMPDVAYNYYCLFREFYERRFLTDGFNNNLFVNCHVSNYHFPYFMIIVSERTKHYDTGIRMYEIIFTKKVQHGDHNSYKNLLFNLQFFIDKVGDPAFFQLFKEYVDFLLSIGVPIFDCDFMKKYEKYGIVNPDIPKFTKEDCKESNKILIYTGFMNVSWNDTYVSNNSIGGAEKAVAYLSRYLPEEYEIYISGYVEDEIVGNIKYIHMNKLGELLEKEKFHTIIISRYISFFTIFKKFSCYQLFLSAHDTEFLNNFDETPVNDIILANEKHVDGVVVLTKWHKQHIICAHPYLSDRIHIINNGILPSSFPLTNKKIKNKFVWTSCSYRGLDILLNLWDQILNEIPDATLDISSYNNFPANKNDESMMTIINKYEGIKHHGKLNTDELYELISVSEYWLYTNTFMETSCITAMEMLMSEVVCLYYPLAGLLDTVGKYGIQVQPGNEIETLLNLTERQKNKMRKEGKEYALSCSWENRAKEWCNVLSMRKSDKIKERIYYLHNNFYLPNDHVNYLKKLSSDFRPRIIYDIGANVLMWQREAKKIWSDSDIVVFDAIETAEFLYKENNLKYHIGVLSDKDEKIVKFYENVEDPAGNSYYKEIGHSNSEKLYPENGYTEKKTMSLTSVVKKNGFPMPDLVKIDVQGAELDILKGGMVVINNAKYLIIELQDTQYNRGAPLAEITIEFLRENGWGLVDRKFCDNGPDGDYCFINEVFLKKNKIQSFLENLSNNYSIPKVCIDYLKNLSITFEPKVIYDIGAAVLHWSKEAREIWCDSEIILFEAIQDCEFLYEKHNYKYNIDVLSDSDDNNVKFYGNAYTLGGCSYYKEIGDAKSHDLYPENDYVMRKTTTLSSAVNKNNFNYPDLIKIDVQGCELDIIKGSLDVINMAKYLIVELQDTQYNRGAPMAEKTINFLQDNYWQLVDSKFSDNGPDADYCFKNKRYDDDFKWLFVYPEWYDITCLCDFFNNIKTRYHIMFANKPHYINDYKPTKITFVNMITDSDVTTYCENNNIKFSYLNTEPLTIDFRLNSLLRETENYKNIKIYDYSKSNIKILNNNGLTNCEYLPYSFSNDEVKMLTKINVETIKTYDFGMITHTTKIPIRPPRRNQVVEFLIKSGFSVNLISGWGEIRDKEIGKCKIILNIHGQINENPHAAPEECSNIFEHIRCNRLLESGFNVLSEESFCLDQNFIDKYPNLKIIKYDDFFNLDTYKNLEWLEKKNELTIFYGIEKNKVDVTKLSLEKCVKDNVLYIPQNDVHRASLFGDPIYRTAKSIFIKNENNIREFNETTYIFIDLTTNDIYSDETRDIPIYIKYAYPEICAEIKLKRIHENLKIEFGSLDEEYPEQIMAATYLTGGEKVLEIGANIGRNSLVIASMLTESRNMVALECDEGIHSQLVRNKEINGLHFFTENSALSNKKLIQRWETMVSDVLLDGYKWVNTITLEHLREKYNVDFDTLILDCEGAFYYILMDMPEILNGINLIIMENDYWDITHKEYIDSVLKDRGFYVDYTRAGGWGPCEKNFFEVWKR